MLKNIQFDFSKIDNINNNNIQKPTINKPNPPLLKTNIKKKSPEISISNIKNEIIQKQKNIIRRSEPLPLEVNNIHERDTRIKFFEKDHYYTIDDNIVERSVTTIAGSIFSKFDPDKAIKSMKSKSTWRDHELYGKTNDEIKNIWNDNGQVASMLGTQMHRAIELYYNNIEQEDHDILNTIEYKYFLNFVKDHPNIIPYRTEWSIYHDEFNIAGQIDLCSINDDGTYSIYDWKRSKKIDMCGYNGKKAEEPFKYIPDGNYWKYTLQLNIYKYILESKYGLKVKDMYIIVCHPNNHNYHKYYMPSIQKTVEAILMPELRESCVYMDNCYKEFRRGIKKMEKMNKNDSMEKYIQENTNFNRNDFSNFQ
jgi:hypothetical protein